MAYTVNEGESVEACAVITTADFTVTAALSGVDGSAIGRNSLDCANNYIGAPLIIKWELTPQ